MAKLYFKFGTMKSGKSHDLVKVATNYDIQGKKCLVVYPNTDTRGVTGEVSSRLGGSLKATPISSHTELSHELLGDNYDAVLVDEAQFLTKEEVYVLRKFTIDKDVPVICYGLLKDFQSNLFEGSKALVELADKFEEIKTECKYCNRKAVFTIRLDGGERTYGGEVIAIGDEEYEPVCAHHFYES